MWSWSPLRVWEPPGGVLPRARRFPARRCFGRGTPGGVCPSKTHTSGCVVDAVPGMVLTVLSSVPGRGGDPGADTSWCHLLVVLCLDGGQRSDRNRTFCNWTTASSAGSGGRVSAAVGGGAYRDCGRVGAYRSVRETKSTSGRSVLTALSPNNPLRRVPVSSPRNVAAIPAAQRRRHPRRTVRTKGGGRRERRTRAPSRPPPSAGRGLSCDRSSGGSSGSGGGGGSSG